MARFRSRVGRWPFSVPDERERADRSQDDRRIAKTPREDWSAIRWRDIDPGAQTERRGGAGPAGGLLGGKAPPAAWFLLQSSLFQTHAGAPRGSRQSDHFPAGARAQGLERWQRREVAQEAYGAVGEGEVGAPRMAA